MSVILLIFKILGMILLILLGLILLLILLVLFCPVCYQARGVLHPESHEAHAKVFWLFGLLALCADMAGEATDLCLRICGIRISFSKKENNPISSEDNIDDRDSANFSTPETETDVSEKTLAAQEVLYEREEAFGESDIPDAPEGLLAKIRRKLDGIRDFLRSIKRMFHDIKASFQKLSSLWEDDDCRDGMKFIAGALFSLLKTIKPYRLKLKLIFSTGSPDTTGQLLGILAMFPIGYQNRWEITPDFVTEKAYADGTFDIRGCLFGFQVLRTAIRIVLDKNCRTLYNRFMKIM